MSLQKEIGLYNAVAIAGQPASVNEAHFTAQTLKGKTAITLGRFVFFAEDADANNYVVQVHNTKPVRGLAMWTRSYIGSFTASMTVPAETSLTVATEGNFWVKCDNPSAAPKVGDKVFAMDADGSIQTHASTLGSAQPTNFVVAYVEEPKNAKSMIIISNLTAAGEVAAA